MLQHQAMHGAGEEAGAIAEAATGTQPMESANNQRAEAEAATAGFSQPVDCHPPPQRQLSQRQLESANQWSQRQLSQIQLMQEEQLMSLQLHALQQQMQLQQMSLQLQQMQLHALQQKLLHHMHATAHAVNAIQPALKPGGDELHKMNG